MSEQDRSKLKKGLVVSFSGTEFIITNLKLDKNKVDLKQNFSIGLIYENISLDDVKLFEEPKYKRFKV